MGTADVAGTLKVSGIMLPPGQQLLAPRKKEKYPQLSVRTAGAVGESESDDSIQSQDVDPQGGEF